MLSIWTKDLGQGKEISTSFTTTAPQRFSHKGRYSINTDTLLCKVVNNVSRDLYLLEDWWWRISKRHWINPTLSRRRYQRFTLNFAQGIACCNTSALLPGNCRKVIISSKPFVGGGQTTLDGHLGKRPHSHHFSPAVVFVYLHLRKSDKD